MSGDQSGDQALQMPNTVFKFKKIRTTENQYFMIRRLPLIGIMFALLYNAGIAQNDSIFDDFEGNGNITTWFGDACGIDLSFPNPYQQGINTSEKVMEYDDTGGRYANVRFDANENFDLSGYSVFTLKIYVPSDGITGDQPNQVSLKLQDASLGQPWLTQTEIIQPIDLDRWQSLTFDFSTNDYINLDPDSPPPTQRTDLNRVLIQVNGEDNDDAVVAYIDDFTYYYTGSDDPDPEPDPEYNVLVWADEFDTDGPIDDSRWHHQTQLPSHGSWYNGEIQHYTNREDNSYVSNGILHIVGKKETFTDQGQTKQYTSARLNSKFAFQNGRVEVRAKLPTGAGTWPAIWMLGKNINEDGGYWDLQGYGTTPWPDCGEIDIMEHWGNNQDYIQSAMHTPSSYGGTINKGGRLIPHVSDEFHTYTLDWYPAKMVFSVDGVVHYTYEPSELNDDTWPFDAEQYILLNFAFLPEIDPEFTEDALEVDYVRIYQKDTDVSVPRQQNKNSLNLKIIPNPANSSTTITYNLSQPSDVKIQVFDVSGRLVQTLLEEQQNAGQQEVYWSVEDLFSGVYFYTIKTNEGSVTRRCVVE